MFSLVYLFTDHFALSGRLAKAKDLADSQHLTAYLRIPAQELQNIWTSNTLAEEQDQRLQLPDLVSVVSLISLYGSRCPSKDKSTVGVINARKQTCQLLPRILSFFPDF